MNLFKIVLYPALKKHFFDLLYNINCDAREYVGCTNVDRYFDIEKVEKQQLIEIEFGVRISRPVAVGLKLKIGASIFSSLSHNGVLAIYNATLFKCQLTDLAGKKQVEIKMNGYAHVGFYDNSMVVLLDWNPLGVCSVEEMFLKKNVRVLKSVGDVKVRPYADVTLLHSTRKLLFTSTSHIPHEFNVDTGMIRELDIGKQIYSFASLTGIDVGVKGMFRENDNNRFTYSFNNDNSTSLVLEHNTDGSLSTFIPSCISMNIKKGMKIYSEGIYFVSTMERRILETPFRYERCQSIVRLYQDIFLVYDNNTRKWCLVKIIVP